MNNSKLDLNYVFIYGNLKTDRSAHHHLEKEILAGKGAIKGRLLNTGRFPALIGPGRQKSKVQGEIYLISNETLEHVDWLKDKGQLFLRKTVIAEFQEGGCNFTATTYFWNGSKEYPVIKSGNWGDKS